MKKLMVIGSTVLVALSLAACSDSRQNDAKAQHDVEPFTLSQHTLIKTFSVDFAESNTDESATKQIDSLTNNYLQKIKNINEYNMELKTNAVEANGNYRGENVEVYTLVLTRK